MIKDSGERTEFETGAVRDCKAGNGRCDLMPLDVISQVLFNMVSGKESLYSFEANAVPVFGAFNKFQSSGDPVSLVPAIEHFLLYREYNIFIALLEVSKHFEEGAKKYGEYNWQKGIRVSSYMDSAIRHYLKCMAGWTDESHDRAFLWNIICCIWTVYHHPELDDWTEPGKKRNENKGCQG